VRLGPEECWRRLERGRHATFATVHPTRGVDAVPVVFAVVDRTIVVPIDTVKPKSTTRLQRLENLRVDPRCSLVVDHYEDDWSQLWWVRVHGRGAEAALTPELVEALTARYPPYRREDAIATAIRIIPDRITGWAAADA
jgi:PPOX class probable F420-dependent enzyme